MRTTTRRAVVGGIAAGALSGAPSTAWALLSGDDPLAAARAAGTLLPGRRDRPGLVAGLVAHVVVSAVWAAVFAVIARTAIARTAVDLGIIGRRHHLGPVSGAAIGAAVAAIDLGIIGRRYPAIAELPQLPQWADHLAFGAILGGLV